MLCQNSKQMKVLTFTMVHTVNNTLKFWHHWNSVSSSFFALFTVYNSCKFPLFVSQRKHHGNNKIPSTARLVQWWPQPGTASPTCSLEEAKSAFVVPGKQLRDGRVQPADGVGSLLQEQRSAHFPKLARRHFGPKFKPGRKINYDHRINLTVQMSLTLWILWIREP